MVSGTTVDANAIFLKSFNFITICEIQAAGINLSIPHTVNNPLLPGCNCWSKAHQDGQTWSWSAPAVHVSGALQGPVSGLPLCNL